MLDCLSNKITATALIIDWDLVLELLNFVWKHNYLYRISVMIIILILCGAKCSQSVAIIEPNCHIKMLVQCCQISQRRICILLRKVSRPVTLYGVFLLGKSILLLSV